MNGKIRIHAQALRSRIVCRLRRRKLGPRLLSGFLFVVLLPIVLLCGIAYQGFREQILQAEERSSLRMAQYVSSELSALMGTYPYKLNTIASDMQVIRLVRKTKKAGVLEMQQLKYQLMSRLTSEASGLTGMMHIEIVNTRGEPLSMLPFSIMDEQLFDTIVSAQEKYAFWVGKYRWGDLYPSASVSKRDKDVILAARRILDYANVKLMGYIVISLDCDEIRRVFSSVQDTRLILSDAQGNVLVSEGGDADTSVLLAGLLSGAGPGRGMAGQTVRNQGEQYLVITGDVAATPYRLTLAIGYRQMLDGLGRVFRHILAAAGGIALLMMGISLCITRSVTDPVAHLTKAMRGFGRGNFEVKIGDAEDDEIGRLCDEFDDMAARVRRLTQQVYVAKIREKDAVYKALQAQINPHFLYNTLDMISWMGYGTSNPDICEVVRALSEFFRLSLNQGEDFFTLADELRHVGSYVAIQRYKMRGVTFLIRAQEEAKALRVPKLIIQPLVENALQHGLRPRNHQGCVDVDCALEENRLVIRVSDDGVGFDEAQMHSRTESCTGYGLRNIRERLELLYGSEGSLSIENRPEGGAVATIRLPVHRSEKAKSLDGT